MASLLVGVVSCFDAPWAEALPEDLPLAWRLGYLANELDALVLSVEELEAAAVLLEDEQELLEGLKEWAEVEDDEAGSGNGRQRGLLVEGDVSRLSWLPQEGNGLPGVVRLSEQRLLRVEADGTLDLADLRARIEAFVGDCSGVFALVFAGEQALDAARQAVTLRDLMGL